MKKDKVSLCVFCGGEKIPLYKMGEYNILKCTFCGAGSVDHLPSFDVLNKKYDGFLGELDRKSLEIIRKAAGEMFKKLGLTSGQELSMLDIGGGGGFFSRSFEDLGYGQSTFLDMDPRSCKFASSELQLNEVINCDVMELDNYIGQRKFDFIFSRHLIEHLSYPIAFLEKSFALLKDDGCFVVQCPNGESLEYLAYVRPHLKAKINSISRTNNYSKAHVLMLLATGGMLHDIDPPRHLWAITEEALRAWAERSQALCEVDYYPLTDTAFSPHWTNRNSIILKLQDFIAEKVFAPIKGGTHLVATFRKTQKTQ